MAIDYDVLFGKLGKLVKNSNSLATLGSTTLPASLQEIVAQYGTTLTGITSSQSAIEGINSSFSSLMQSVAGMRQAIRSFADVTLLDYDTIVSQFPGMSDFSVNEVLVRLYQDMIDNDETVVTSTVTVGSVTAGERNTGNGTVLIGTTLDGVTAPVSGGIVQPLYAGIGTQMAPGSILHSFTCVQDSYTDGLDPGSEVFSWSGPVDWGEVSPFGEGSGQGPVMPASGGASIVSGGKFESGSVAYSGASSSETACGSGVAGWTTQNSETQVKVASDGALAGEGSLRFASDGTEASYTLDQGVVLTPLKLYQVTAFVIRHKSVSDGTLSLFFSADDGYTSATGGQSYTTPVSSLPTTWTRISFNFIPPSNLPDNPVFSIRLGDTPASGVEIGVDMVDIVPVPYHAGVSANVVRGIVPFVRGDRFWATVTSSEGVFQKFFRTHFLCQLPAAPGGSGAFSFLPPYSLFSGTSAATLSDSLAT